MNQRAHVTVAPAPTSVSDTSSRRSSSFVEPVQQSRLSAGFKCRLVTGLACSIALAITIRYGVGSSSKQIGPSWKRTIETAQLKALRLIELLGLLLFTLGERKSAGARYGSQTHRPSLFVAGYQETACI